MPAFRKHLNILVTDDSSTIRKFIIRALGKVPGSFNITEAVEGNGCCKLLETGDFDIAFIDVNMPGMSGFEAIKKASVHGRKTFTVMMSSKSDQSVLDEAKSLKAYDYLVKPFTDKDIAEVIHKYTRFVDETSVLLVDDSRAIRKVVKNVLKNSRFNITIDEAMDGPSAVLSYKNNRYDIVFLDLHMPGIDGYGTLKMLKELNENVKVVVVTADQNVNFKKINAKYGIEKLLYKPFFTADVDRILHELFDLKLPNLLVEKPNISVEGKNPNFVMV